MSEIDERVRGDRDTEIRKVENGKYKRETKKERQSEREKKKKGDHNNKKIER